MFGDGVAIIESALSQFTKVKERLEAGIVAVNNKIGDNLKKIQTITDENSTLTHSKKLAEKAHYGITRLLEGN